MSGELSAKMKEAHEVLYEFSFEVVPLDRGYSNRTLRIDLDKNEVSVHPVSEQMKKLWTGGKGFDLWLMFQEINKDSKWDSPENSICFSAGPLGGTTSFPGSGKTLVTTISPLTHSIIDCNVGGYFGPYLKFAGFDALCIVGKAKEDVLVLIDAVNEKIMIETAPLESQDSHILADELTRMYSDGEMDYRNIACVSAGRGAEHARMGVLNFSFWDWRRGVARLKQAGRGGIGTVFRNKKLKALVIKNKEFMQPWKVTENKVAERTLSRICSCEKTDIEQVRDIVKKWNADPDYVIEMMQDVQDRDRYISLEAVQEISLRTGVPKSQLYHIATFYKAFSLNPRGEILIQVCIGTSCHVNGSAKILRSFARVLGIKQGETTKDEKFTLETVACLGNCSMAPSVKVGDKILAKVQNKDVALIIENALEESKHDGKKVE